MNIKKRLGVIGQPISHSLSPIIHQHWLDENHILMRYEKLEIAESKLMDFLAELKNDFLGINITLPYKETIYGFAKENGWHIGAEAELSGSVNMISVKGDEVYANSYDGEGFLRSLNIIAPGWNFEKPVMIIGAGGAAASIALRLNLAGAKKFYIVNRTEKNAEKLAQKINGECEIMNWENYNLKLGDVGLLIQASSLGMKGKKELEFDLSGLANSALVADIVYSPLETKLLKLAAFNNNIVIDGLGMLLHQAQLAFEDWFDVKVEVSENLRKRVEKFL